MDAHSPQDEAAFRAAFLDRFLADRLAGGPQAPLAYRQIFAAHGELVDRELAALASACAAQPGAARDLGTIGSYRLLGELGRGGQGIVYLAEDLRLRRRVALKVLPSLGLQAQELAPRFQREAEVASRLDHPGICAIYEAGAADGMLYIAMRYVEGRTLAAHLDATRGPATARTGVPASRREIDATLELFEKCALSLHHAHESGVVHRDVKPTNVLIDGRGEPVILDFGVARGRDDAALTRTGEFLGTPAYASPELLAGRRTDVDRRTDVYSLGVSLYEALTGRRPFEAPTPEGLFQAILTSEPPDPRRLNRALSADLRVVLETALEKDVRRRYATALDLALDLRAVRRREPIRARPAPAARRLVRWAQRAPARAALVLVLATGLPAVTGLGGYLLAARDTLAAGRSAQVRSRVDRAVDRGFMALLTASTDPAAEFEEALALDRSSLEATAGLTLHLLGLPGGEGPGKEPRLGEALTLLEQQERLLGRQPDLLRLKLLCAETAGDEEQAEALRREIGGSTSALACVIGAVRLWNLAVGSPNNHRAAGEMYHLASMACDLEPRPQLFHHVLRGLAASAVSDVREAERCVDVIIALWPDDPEAALAAAGVAPRSERSVRLIEEEVLPFQPEAPLAWMLLGLAWWEKDGKRAAECLERALELGGPNPFILSRLGRARLMLGRPGEALEAFEQALALDGRSAEVLVGRGLAYQELGDTARAEEDFRRSLGLWDGYYGGELALGSLLAETGRAEEALSMYRHCVQVDELSPAWLRIPGVLRLAGRDDEARAAWEEATRRLPEDPNAWNSLAWFHVDPLRKPELWSPDVAVGAAELALRLPGGEQPYILNTLGVALYRRGDDERACEELRASAKLQAERQLPPSVGVHAFLAAAAARLGRWEEAEESLDLARRLLALDPDDAGARAALAEAEAALAAARNAGGGPR